MIVDEAIYTFWKEEYGELQTLKRVAIANESDEVVVEVYYKKIQIIPLPNKMQFKTFKNEVQA